MTLELNNPELLREQAYINGVWVNSDTSETRQVKNPYDNSLIAEIASCGSAETLRAISAASDAFKLWRQTTVNERHSYLMKWYDLIRQNVDDLALILTSEQGKPLSEAKGEIFYGANYVQWFAEESKRMNGDTIAGPTSDSQILVLKRPIGVVACITPWNFPSAMLARKIAPALAAGNTVVCKPANETPFSAMALGVLAEKAGIPAGVINILCGRTPEIGAAITSSPIVRKLTFTGSTAVGKKLTKDCAGTLKRLSMELGGNAPFIVFDDANCDEAIEGLMSSKFRNAGQTCVCSNRIFVQAGIYDQFVEAAKKAVDKLNVGSGFEDAIDIGPLVNENAAKGVRDLIEDAVKEGANLLTSQNFGEGCFVVPTMLEGVTSKMSIFHEEIFGPVAPIIKFDSEEEVVEEANNTPYGLAAYFFSRDIGRIWRVSEGLEYGMIAINTGRMSSEMLPFGGVKESGHGREGSKYGLDDYMEIKSLTLGSLHN